MIPQNTKMDFSYKPSKGYDCENDVYKKYGKDYRIKDYVNEYKDGTVAKDIIAKAGGLDQLPGAMARLKDADIVIDMSDDLFTINRKIKLGQIAQRKIDAIKAAEELAKQQAQQTNNTEAE